MDIVFRGELTREDMVEEIRLRFLEDERDSRRVLRILAALGFAGSLAVLPFASDSERSMLYLSIGGAVLLFALSFALPQFFRLVIRAESQNVEVPQGTYSGSLSDERAAIVDPAGDTHVLDWSRIRKVRSSDLLLVLVLARDTVALLPRRFFADQAAFETACALAAARRGSPRS